MQDGDFDFGQIMHTAVTSDPPDYTRYHVAACCSNKAPKGQDVLVIGCNRGAECRVFMEYGAASVTGVDIMPDTGADFPHPNAKYLVAFAEKLDLPDESADVIFCFATLEHVQGIEDAFAEMARILRPGGLMYTVAAPLWRSRTGPHWGGLFDDIPWPHLRLTLPEIVTAGEIRGATKEQVEYWVSDQVNKRGPKDYVNACKHLPLKIIVNNLDKDPKQGPPHIVADLKMRGFTDEDLYSGTHQFIATK